MISWKGPLKKVKFYIFLLYIQEIQEYFSMCILKKLKPQFSIEKKHTYIL